MQTTHKGQQDTQEWAGRGNMAGKWDWGWSSSFISPANTDWTRTACLAVGGICRLRWWAELRACCLPGALTQTAVTADAHLCQCPENTLAAGSVGPGVGCAWTGRFPWGDDHCAGRGQEATGGGLCRTSPGMDHRLEREPGGILSCRAMWSSFCFLLSMVRGVEEGRGSKGRKKWRWDIEEVKWAASGGRAGREETPGKLPLLLHHRALCSSTLQLLTDVLLTYSLVSHASFGEGLRRKHLLVCACVEIFPRTHICTQVSYGREKAKISLGFIENFVSNFNARGVIGFIFYAFYPWLPVSFWR